MSENEYKQIYPSGSLIPVAYSLIKAHKKNKNFPARNIISHRGCPQEALASYLIPLIQPLVDACDYTCKNSVKLVQSLKEITLKEDEYLVSFDAEAIFPSIPLQKCIALINKELKKDTYLHKRTSLTADDITGVINLCMFSANFIYDNTIYSMKDSGPMGSALWYP